GPDREGAPAAPGQDRATSMTTTTTAARTPAPPSSQRRRRAGLSAEDREAGSFMASPLWNPWGRHLACRAASPAGKMPAPREGLLRLDDPDVAIHDRAAVALQVDEAQVACFQIDVVVDPDAVVPDRGAD